MRREALMHLDGCHFFVWVGRDPDGQVVLTYDERRGTDLRLHGRFGHDEDGECDRCKALRAGASPASVSRHIDRWPNDAKESMFRVFEVIAEIENGAGEDSRSSLPVAPDGPVSRRGL